MVYGLFGSCRSVAFIIARLYFNSIPAPALSFAVPSPSLTPCLHTLISLVVAASNLLSKHFSLPSHVLPLPNLLPHPPPTPRLCLPLQFQTNSWNCSTMTIKIPPLPNQLSHPHSSIQHHRPRLHVSSLLLLLPSSTSRHPPPSCASPPLLRSSLFRRHTQTISKVLLHQQHLVSSARNR